MLLEMALETVLKKQKYTSQEEEAQFQEAKKDLLVLEM